MVARGFGSYPPIEQIDIEGFRELSHHKRESREPKEEEVSERAHKKRIREITLQNWKRQTRLEITESFTEVREYLTVATEQKSSIPFCLFSIDKYF